MQVDFSDFTVEGNQEPQVVSDELFDSLLGLFPDDTLTTSPNSSMVSQAEHVELPATVDPSELDLEAPPGSLFPRQAATLGPSPMNTPHPIEPDQKRRKMNGCEPPATTDIAMSEEMWHFPDLRLMAPPTVPGAFPDQLGNPVAPIYDDLLLPETIFPAPSAPSQLPDAFLYAPPAADFRFAPILAPPVAPTIAPQVVPPVVGTPAQPTTALITGLPPEQPSLFPPSATMPAPANEPQDAGRELTICEDPLSMPKNFVPNPNNHGRHEIINGRKIYLNAPKERIEAARASSGAAAGGTGGKRPADKISN